MRGTYSVEMIFGLKQVRHELGPHCALDLLKAESQRRAGVYEANLGQPARAINCVNCGAPRVATRGACDYCGSAR
jgi:hypothetical protein